MNQETLSLAAIREFKKQGADINYRDRDGKTALTYAKNRRTPWPKAIDLLIELGATE